MAKLLTEQTGLFCPQPGNSNAWFEGAHLLPLLRKVLTLPDGPETDLLQYLDRLVDIRHNLSPFSGNLISIDLPTFDDRIMESLNLLRYLVIRDKVTENQVSSATAACDGLHPTTRFVPLLFSASCRLGSGPSSIRLKINS